MKDRYIAVLAMAGIICLLSYTSNDPRGYTVEELRTLYSSGDQSRWPAPHLFDEAKEGFQDIGVLPEMKFPEDNPYSEDKMELGKMLFLIPDFPKVDRFRVPAATMLKPDGLTERVFL
jgi:cytochrome c peroxidase